MSKDGLENISNSVNEYKYKREYKCEYKYKYKYKYIYKDRYRYRCRYKCKYRYNIKEHFKIVIYKYDIRVDVQRVVKLH